jgi:UDPglucose 6-dehydrogenase
VIVPTPSNTSGAFSLQYAKWAFKEIGKGLKEKKGYHNVVLTSTVLPGATRYGLLPILERESGKGVGSGFGLCYSPEFIALGSVIHDFLNPDFTLVGEFDEKCGTMLQECYSQIMMNDPPCRRMSIENAELTKISVNTFVTTKITFANMLAELCSRIPGGDIDVVTGALGSDRRIGSHYLKGGLGYGGPCFPRDNVALSYISRALGVNFDLADVTDRVNRTIPKEFSTRLLAQVSRDKTVAVLGLAYKPHSHVVEESQGLEIANNLSQDGVRIVAYDPLAREMARNDIYGKVVILDSVSECLQQADIVVITTPDPEFRQLKFTDFSTEGKSEVTVYDFWRVLAAELTNRPNINYIPIGKSVDDAKNSLELIKLWGK